MKKIFESEEKRYDFAGDLIYKCFDTICEIEKYCFDNAERFTGTMMRWIKKRIGGFPDATTKVTVYYMLETIFFSTEHLMSVFGVCVDEDMMKVIALHANQISQLLMGQPDMVIKNMEIKG